MKQILAKQLLVVYILIFIQLINFIEPKKIRNSTTTPQPTTNKPKISNRNDTNDSSSFDLSLNPDPDSSLPIEKPELLIISSIHKFNATNSTSNKLDSTDQLDQQDYSGNGSAILEDLVNQFLQINNAAMQQNQLSDTLKTVEEIHKQQHQRRHAAFLGLNQLDNSNNSSLADEILVDDMDHDRPLHAIKLTNSLIDNNEQLNGLSHSHSNYLIGVQPAEQNSIVGTTEEDIDDKHIHYDVIPTRPLNSDNNTDEKQPILDRHSANYKLEPELEVNSSTTVVNKTHQDDSVVPLQLSSGLVSSTRSSNIQARSMQNGPPTGKYSRQPPPYASYDSYIHQNQLEHRHDIGEIDKASSKSENISTLRDSDQPANQLLNSINRISTHLNDHQPEHVKGSMDQSSSSIENEQIQKLAAINKIVDLNPIDTIPTLNFRQTNFEDNQNHKIIQDDMLLSVSQYYYPNREQQQSNRGSHANDRYADHQVSSAKSQNTFPLPMEPSTYTQIASKLIHGLHVDHQPASNNLESERSLVIEPSSPIDFNEHGFKRKILSTHQYQSSDITGTTNSSSAKMATGLINKDGSQLKQQSTELSHNPSHYVASLVNVTAPISSPIPQTEAIESSSENSLAYQVSGFLKDRTKNPINNSIIDQQQNPTSTTSTTTTSKPKKHNNLQTSSSGHLSTTSSTGELQQQAPPMYSQPANQFSPRPFFPTSENSGVSSESADSLTATERMRLEATNRFGLASSLVSKKNNSINSINHQASGFRAPFNSLYQSSSSLFNNDHNWSSGSHLPSSYLSGNSYNPTAATTTTVTTNVVQPPSSLNNSSNAHTTRPPTTNSFTSTSAHLSTPVPTTNGFITTGSQLSGGSNLSTNSSSPSSNKQHQIESNLSLSSSLTSSQVSKGQQNNLTIGQQNGLSKRVFNLTRVEHISAECSNDLIRTVIVFNGTFRGIIYSSGYVRDPNCIYVNGNGDSRYDFSIKLNKCGTLGRQQEVHPTGGGVSGRIGNELSRRDQVMWNTLSIQYNPVIEQEWDEHFRVSCEYGSDFWKTISFNPFNVETNTGSPVVFTVDPPQCQMEILRGHGMVGPRQEAVSGPVTVGDPLTLLIHMKSEKAGYDILVKNCIAHNGGHQKMQLIDSNGCVVDERFIGPFRGTYNDNDLKHVTLYSYLKAFRFTGSPVLYLECEIHMCQTACPPQMCYWRRLSKRSTGNNSTLISDDNSWLIDDENNDEPNQYLSSTTSTTSTTMSPKKRATKRTGRSFSTTKKPSENDNQQKTGLSDKVSLFQALEVRQERESADAAAYSLDLPKSQLSTNSFNFGISSDDSLMCYRRAELLAFIITAASVILVALSVTIGCCWRAISLRRRDRRKLISARAAAMAANINCANNKYNLYSTGKPASTYAASSLSGSSSATRISTPMIGSPSSLYQAHQQQLQQNHHHHHLTTHQHHNHHISPVIYASPSINSKHKSNHLLMSD